MPLSTSMLEREQRVQSSLVAVVFASFALSLFCVACSGLSSDTSIAAEESSNEYSDPHYLRWCTTYANGVESAYVSVESRLSEATPAERHRLALTLDTLAGEQLIIDAIVKISYQNLARSLVTYEEFDPNDPEFLENVVERHATIVAGSNDVSDAFTIVLNQLSDRLLKMRLGYMRTNRIDEDLSVHISAATTDMLAISSVCKEAGLPYADAHRGIV